VRQEAAINALFREGRMRLPELRRMRLLDLFCCAGGASMGYHRAGFDVVGVDINPQPHYPFAFIQHDAMTLDMRFLRSFDAIHASPPCQGYTTMQHAPGAVGAPRLIGAVRKMLEATGLPYVIENVEGARDEMPSAMMLCGSAFGLGAQGCELRRHRLFEANFKLQPVSCKHTDKPVIGIYGGHARKRSAKHGGRRTKDVWAGGHRAAAEEALGMHWATLAEMSEAIPPEYTRHIGRALKWEVDGRRMSDNLPRGERKAA
jgi:DNA (cytosine-5)-methyltransferase 1